MANEYYDHTTYPATGAFGSSSSARAEFDSVEAGFAKLVTLSGNGNKLMKVNSGASAHTTSIITDNGTTVTVAGALAATGALAITGAITGATFNGLTITTSTGTLTITNGKTLSCSNTLTFAGTDGSTLNVGTGGTLGTAAYTASSSYGLKASPLSQFAATTSAQLAGVISDETGSGSLVFADGPTLTTPTIGVATATSINKVAITAPASSATLTIADGKTATINHTLTLAGTDGTTMTFPSTSATLARTDAGNTFTGAQVISASSGTALTVTNTGSGDCLLVEDSAGDATAFAIDGDGNVRMKVGANYATLGALNIAVGGATIGAITSNTGTTSARSHYRLAISDVEVGAIGTQGSDMTFLTGGTERFRIGSAGNQTIVATSVGVCVSITGSSIEGAVTNIGTRNTLTFGSTATTRGLGYQTMLNTTAASFTLGEMTHFKAEQDTLGASSAVTNQYGFFAQSSLTGATNNYGFYGNIASGSNRWNFYAVGTAANHFAGNVLVGTTSANASGAKLQTSDGITFPATAVASSDANTLDDYEEGTFTPVSEGQSAAGAGTYSVQVGTYTKIGNRVFFGLKLAWSAHTGTGNLQVGGLPFTSSSTANTNATCCVAQGGLVVGAGKQLSATIATSATKIVLFADDDAGGATANVAMDTAVTLLQISGSYIV